MFNMGLIITEGHTISFQWPITKWLKFKRLALFLFTLSPDVFLRIFLEIGLKFYPLNCGLSCCTILFNNQTLILDTKLQQQTKWKLNTNPNWWPWVVTRKCWFKNNNHRTNFFRNLLNFLAKLNFILCFTWLWTVVKWVVAS